MGFHHRQAVENPWVLQPLLPRPGSFYHTDLVGVLRNLSVLFRAYFDAFGIYSTFDFFFLKVLFHFREKERDLAYNPGMCPDWESNR